MNRASLRRDDRTSRAWELLVALDQESSTSLRRQLAQGLREVIRQGALPVGTRLPSTRALADQLGVSRGTVVDGYSQLAAEGYLELRARSRPLVRASASPAPEARAAESAAPRPRYDLVATTPDLSLFPRREWLKALRRTLTLIPDGELDYDWSAIGTLALREALSEYLARVRGVAAGPDEIFVTNGFKHGLDLVCRVLAARGAGRVAVEDPSFNDQWVTIRRNGLEVVPIAVDDRGLRVEDLVGQRVDAVVTTPAHQFPTGAVLAPDRRRYLLGWAEANGVLVLEDDYDAEYRYDRAPVGTLQGLAPSCVIYFGTTSKTLAPALRLGWLAAPREIVHELAAARWASDSCCRPIEAHAYADLLRTGEIDRQLRKTRPVYRRRRELLASAVVSLLPETTLVATSAGLHTVLYLPDGYDEDAIAATAEDVGIRIRSLRSYRLSPTASDQPALVIGYGRLSEAAIPSALRLLASAIESVHGAGPSGAARPRGRPTRAVVTL
jgi:GntR family transcriptional regulator / MocR family aminotransferase